MIQVQYNPFTIYYSNPTLYLDLLRLPRSIALIVEPLTLGNLYSIGNPDQIQSFHCLLFRRYQTIDDILKSKLNPTLYLVLPNPLTCL